MIAICYTPNNNLLECNIYMFLTNSPLRCRLHILRDISLFPNCVFNVVSTCGKQLAPKYVYRSWNHFRLGYNAKIPGKSKNHTLVCVDWCDCCFLCVFKQIVFDNILSPPPALPPVAARRRW